MKNLEICLTLSLALVFFPAFIPIAESVEVTSNIVGQNQITLQQGRNFVGLNFKNPEGGSYNVQELFDTSVLEGGSNRMVSDQLILWNTVDQKYIRLWLATDGTCIDTSTGRAADRVIPAGSAFWIIKQTNEELTETKPF